MHPMQRVSSFTMANDVYFMFLFIQRKIFHLAHARRRHHQRGEMSLPTTRQMSTDKHVRYHRSGGGKSGVSARKRMRRWFV
jgi:hypothetical protein